GPVQPSVRPSALLLFRRCAPLRFETLFFRGARGPRLVARRRSIRAARELFPQALQCRREVLGARALILAFGDDSRGPMDEPHGSLGLVAVLAARAAGAVHLHVALREKLCVG